MSKKVKLIAMIILSCMTLGVAAKEEKTTECKEIKTALSANDTLAIRNFNQNTPFAMRQRCITQILTQPAVRVNFTLFKQWVQAIIAMDLTNQQDKLDAFLDSYVDNDKQAQEHKYIEELLSLGANPAATSRHGTHILGEAFWATSVGGGTCESINLIIDALSKEDLATPYPNRPGGYHEKNIGATPLMSMADLGLNCPNEALLVAKKAYNIDQQDNNGNTALHHFYLDIMSKAFLLDYQIDLIEILSKRGASFNIPNKDNVTANQLRLNLRENQGKCGELCDRL